MNIPRSFVPFCISIHTLMRKSLSADRLGKLKKTLFDNMIYNLSGKAGKNIVDFLDVFFLHIVF